MLLMLGLFVPLFSLCGCSCNQSHLHVWAVSGGDEHAVESHVEGQQKKLEEGLQGLLSYSCNISYKHICYKT